MNQTVVDFEAPNVAQQTTWLTGRVLSSHDMLFEVQVTGERKSDMVQKAYSCLMRPEPDDLVCLIRSETGQLYVSAILERQMSATTDLAEATLSFAGKLTLEANELQGIVPTVNWFSRLIQATSRDILVTSNLSRLTCAIREMFTGQSHMSADNSYRHIRKTEMLRTEVYDLQASSLASVKAPCTMIKGDRLVKVDSSQVHIG